MPGDVVIASTIIDTPTTAQILTYTTTALGGRTPKLVRAFWLNNDTLGTEKALMTRGEGMTTGTHQASLWGHVEDASASPAVMRWHADDRFVFYRDPSGNGIRGNFWAFVADGITIQWQITNGSPPSFKVLLVFYAGADLQAASGSDNNIPSGNVTRTQTPGFPADVVGVFGIDNPITNALKTDQFTLGSGFAVWNGTSFDQRGWAVYAANAPIDVFIEHSETHVVPMFEGSGGVSTKVDNRTSTTFDLVKTGAGTLTGFSWWALSIDTLSAKALTVTNPSSTGADSVTTVGFQPQYLELITGLVTTGSAHTGTSTTIESMTVSAIAASAYSFNSRTTPQANPSVSKSRMDQAEAIIVNSTGTVLDHSFTSFTSSGWDRTVNTAAGVGSQLVLAISEPPSGGAIVEPPTASLTLAGQTPTVSLGPLVVTPSTATLNLVGQVPSVVVSGNVTIEPSTATLALVGQTPTVSLGPLTVTPATATLTLAAQTPTVSLGPLTVTPPTATLTLTGNTPTVSVDANVTVQPPTATLTLVGQTPTVSLGPLTVTPATATLTLTGQTPTVSVGANVTIQPPTATLTLVGQTPTVVVGANVTIEPPTATLTLVGTAPTVGLGPLTITPATATLTLTGNTPTVLTSSALSPASSINTFRVPPRSNLKA